MAYKRSTDEMQEALGRQINHLRRSCIAYDQGTHEEAERIASCVYILAHDGGDRSKSLLGELGYKSTMNFFTTTGAHALGPRKINIMPSLIGVTFVRSKAIYTPHLAGAPFGAELVTFDEWWDENVIQRTVGASLSRKKLVFALRSQDGGSHVDRNLTDDGYVYLSKRGGNWFSSSGNSNSQVEHSPMENGHWASMRQIGWEIDESLKLIGL